MRRYLILFCAMALLLSLSCKKAEEENPYATPETTIKEYALAMKEGDFDRAIKCYSQDALVDINPAGGKLTTEELKSLFISSLKASQEPFKKGDVTVVDVKMIAKVKFKVAGEDREFTMIKEPEGWKIATNL